MESPDKISTIATLRGVALKLVLDRKREWRASGKHILSKSLAIQLLLTEYSLLIDRNKELDRIKSEEAPEVSYCAACAALLP